MQESREYEMLLKTIVELIDKCDNIDELRDSMKRIMTDAE